MPLNLQNLTPDQKKKIRKLQKLANSGDPIGIFKELEEVEKQMTEIENKITELKTPIKGDKGDPGKDGKDGQDGKDYVLTEPDKKEIASKVAIPIIEKVIERTEVIREQPIITQEIKEVAVKDTPEQIADKLNTLEQTIEQNVIIGLAEEIKKLREEIKSKPAGGMRGMRKVPIIQRYDLTSQCDGATKSFILPADTKKVIGVFGTQFPVVFAPNTDWTFAGRTLTLTGSVGAPQSGQTLWVLIETLFYA